MGYNLRNRSYVKELDFTPDELKFLLKLSAELKAAKYGGYEQPRLAGKNIALIFEKTSTRPGRRSRWPPTIRARRSPTSNRPAPDRPQGIDEGHGPGVGPHVRRDRVPRVRAGDGRDPGGVRRRPV